jgi:hypothetical protein
MPTPAEPTGLALSTDALPTGRRLRAGVRPTTVLPTGRGLRPGGLRTGSTLRTGIVPLTGIVLVLGLVACGGPPSPAASAHDQAVPVWRAFVQCARGHGAAELPDPVVDDQGRATFPDDALARVPDPVHRRIMDTCSPILERLPASAAQEKAPTAAQIRALTEFARCMRAHGLPDWPDPRSDAAFALPTRLANQPKNAIQPQLLACGSYLDHASGHLDFVPPDAPPATVSPSGWLKPSG